MKASTFNKILNVIHHMGMNIEQDIQSFSKLSEPQLRSHLLSVLKSAYNMY